MSENVETPIAKEEEKRDEPIKQQKLVEAVSLNIKSMKPVSLSELRNLQSKLNLWKLANLKLD